MAYRARPDRPQATSRRSTSCGVGAPTELSLHLGMGDAQLRLSFDLREEVLLVLRERHDHRSFEGGEDGIRFGTRGHGLMVLSTRSAVKRNAPAVAVERA